MYTHTHTHTRTYTHTHRAVATYCLLLTTATGLWAGIFIVATQYVVPSVGNTFSPLENGKVI